MNEVTPLLPVWPMVRCDNCGHVYEIPESDEQFRIVTANCPRCGHGQFSTTMQVPPGGVVSEATVPEATNHRTVWVATDPDQPPPVYGDGKEPWFFDTRHDHDTTCDEAIREPTAQEREQADESFGQLLDELRDGEIDAGGFLNEVSHLVCRALAAQRTEEAGE